MRVLYLLNFAGKAGTERYVQKLIETLSPNRIEPYFVYNIEGLLAERLRELGVPTRQLTMKSRFDKTAARALAQICKEWKIDVIHTHYLRENYIAMLSKRWNPGVKVVYTSHFVMGNNWYTRLSNRRFAPKQDGVIAVCTVGKQQLIANGLDGNKIQVVFNGVDPKEELGLSADTFVMLCASRFADDKGHAYLIDSIALLNKRTDRPFHLLLAGDGELLPAAKAQVEALGLGGCISFLGFRTDMKNLFHSSDLYVNASRHEALSFLIVEAMAAGLPVIATDMGGNSDIVNPENNCGILVEYNNPESMASAMAKLMAEPARLEDYRAGAKRAVETVFHVNQMAGAAYALYETVMKGGGGA